MTMVIETTDITATIPAITGKSGQDSPNAKNNLGSALIEWLIRETLPVTGHRFWALGQDGIYFVDAQKTPAVLKFVDLVSRKVTVMATLAKPPAKFTRGLSISPDGRYALFCQDDVDRYEIRVVENFR
jgi:hypothetical protein